MIDKKKYIEISPGYFYEFKSGLPYTNRVVVKNTGTYGTHVEFTNTIRKCVRIHDDGYMVVSIDSKNIKWHRLVYEYFKSSIPNDMFCDHIDNNRENNKISNLQLLSKLDNARKRMISKNNTSGCAGVSYDSINRKWKAQICVDYKTINLGRFIMKEEAYQAYLDAKIKLHGEFSIYPLGGNK